MTATARERQSAVTTLRPANIGLFPDNTIDQGDRQTIDYSYSGILADPAVPVEALPPGGMLAAKHVRRKMKWSRR